MLHPMFYIQIACSVPIAAMNVASLVLYFRRTHTTSKYGMLFALLLTYLLYGILTFLCYVLFLVPGEFYTMAMVTNYSVMTLYSLTPFVSQLIVTFCSTMIALDRVILMAVPMSYAFANVSLRLSTAVGVVSAVTILFFICSSLAVTYNMDFQRFIEKLQRTLEADIVPGALLLELLFYFIFMLQLRSYSKNTRNTVSKKQTAETNHIVLFQMLCHTLLCFTPHVFRSLRLNGVEMDWYSKIDDYTGAMFAVSVLLSSGFTLFKLRPKCTFIKVTSTATASGRK